MTREEQIIKAADEYYLGQHFNDIKIFHFVNGAKWADKTMLEKVATWLWENFYNNPHVNGIVSSDAFNNVDDMIDVFFKAMEE